MANEIRRRYNFLSGTVDDNPLTNSATTLNSTELAGLPAIAATEHAVLVLDPTGAGNGPEVVYVTAHTGSATSATIVRGREGTSSVQHASTVTWVHVATAADWGAIGDDNDEPSTGGLPYESQVYVDTTNDRIKRHTSTTWMRVAHYSPAGRTGGQWRRSSAQSIATGTVTTVTFPTEDWDSDGVLTPTSGTATIPSGCGGLWWGEYTVVWEGTNGNVTRTWMAVNDSTTLATDATNALRAAQTDLSSSFGNNVAMSGSTIMRLAAADIVRLQVHHTNGASNDIASAVMQLVYLSP